MNYYNEIDPKAADWLRELIAGGHIPVGDVDERSIIEISPDELSKYTQCHFFAGIGGWSLALELAGWPATRPIWTGSCPCQPFSGAGKGKGASDDRHLWPVFRRLIAELHPERVFGEQVTQAIGFNWLDGVSADLEADGYTVGAVVLGAHSVGAPHIRQRLYWLANSNGQQKLAANPIRLHSKSCSDSDDVRVGNAKCGRRKGWANNREATDLTRSRRDGINAWNKYNTITATNKKTRRIEPRIIPLAHGVSGRVGLLRGYGNAIVPQVAAEFVMACSEILPLNIPITDA